MNARSIPQWSAAGCLLTAILCCTTGCPSSQHLLSGGATTPEITDTAVDGSLTEGKPATIAVRASAVEVGGTIASVVADLSQIGGNASQSLDQTDGNVWTWQGSVTPAHAGTWQVTFTATDPEGLTGTATASVGVTNSNGQIPSNTPGNSPPSITTPAASTSLMKDAPGELTLSVKATDPDGSVKSVTANLSEVGGQSAAAMSPGDNDVWTFSGTVTPTAEGPRTIFIQAMDDLGATSSVNINVSVAPLISVDIQKMPLGGGTDLSDAQIAKLYVPSRYGGSLTISGASMEVVYTDGADPTPGLAAQVFLGNLPSAVVAQGDPCSYSVPEGSPGWYYIRLTPRGSATLQNSYVEDGEASYRPWNGWWWPFLPSRGPTLYDPGGPLDKYDQVYGTDARGWEADNKSRGQDWFGHCWGWSIASILIDPPHATSKSGVDFTADDMKGLYTELCDNVPYIDQSMSIHYIPPTAPTSSPGEDVDLVVDEVHRVLRANIREDSVPLQSNLRAVATPPDGIAEVWNGAVYRYYSAWQEAPGANDEHLVQIDTTITSNFGPWPPPTDYMNDRQEEFVYQIEFDSQGQIVPQSPRQNWISASHYPPQDLNRLTGSPFEAGAPGVTKANVDALYGP